MSGTLPLSARPAPDRRAAEPRAGVAPVLALTGALALAAFLILMAAVLLVVHPQNKGLGAFTPLVNQQNQKAKSFLYVAAFAAILPLSLLSVPRLADKIAAGANREALPALAASLVATLAVVLIVLRAASADGLVALLAAVGAWSVAAAAALRRAAAERPWRALLALRSIERPLIASAAVLLFAVLVAVTRRSSLHVLPLIAGGVLAVALTLAIPRASAPRLPRASGVALDVIAVALILLAVPNVVIFHTSGQLPSIYIPPGLYQNQQDYLLGSVNQLLHGGALLVNVPVSQYGVGMAYFLAGWFHLAPIGYGTLGFLDGILTALFYVAGYAVLRAAGVRRALAIPVLAVAVIALIFGLRYPVGALPETGALRFGLPIAVVLATVIGMRWPRRGPAADAAALVVLGLSAVWAFEAFAYTLVVFAAIAAARVWLSPRPARRAWLMREALRALAVCVAAHILLALATLAGTGTLPDWGQYLAYLRSFLLGGEAGAISYGFAHWSPGLAFGAAIVLSCAALLLLASRAPAALRSRPSLMIGLTGSTAYAVALLSYVDNRSLTYLLPYVALPLVLAGAMWLELLLEHRHGAARRGLVAFALALAVLLIAAAWPFIGTNFSQSAMAHLRPSGGLRTALHRLWHPPPIDPRAPVGERLLKRYIPGRRVIVLLPTVPDLGVEMLMRSGRANSLFIGDPVDDSLVLKTWKPRLRTELDRLLPGQRLLIDERALAVIAGLRAHPSIDPGSRPILGGDQEIEWILRELDRRFRLVPIIRDQSGLIVARLAPKESF